MSARMELKTRADLVSMVEDIGFLPLYRNAVPGFSVREMTDRARWHDGREADPWLWRQAVAAEGNIAYGKFFKRKAGFISARWLPLFANARRDGYDFDALYEDGKASFAQKRVMDCFMPEGNTRLPAHRLKKQAGFHKDKPSGFDTTLAQLQMQTYLVICGFERKRNRMGMPYGWPVSLYAMPETLFGFDFVRSRYAEQPAASFEAIVSQAACIRPAASIEDLRAFLR